MKDETLKLTVEKALEAYKNGTPEHKQLLIDLYGKHHFLINIQDRVFDYPSACAEIGLDPLEVDDFDFLPEIDRNKAYVRHQLTIQTRALNEGWEPDFKKNDYKYYNYFYWDTSKNGFSSLVSDHSFSASVGSDLMFKNNALAEYARKAFEKQYIAYHFNK